MSWCTIESDPGVFSELISAIGVKGIEVDEIYDFSNESFDKLQPYGLIFLFKWQQDEKDDRPVVTEKTPGLFFAKQVITNACATQAILSILLNRPEIDIGSELSTLKTFTKDLSPADRGYSIGNSTVIRDAHNSFARPEPLLVEEVAATKDDDVFHFVGYVPVKGKVYELDGLKNGPISLGDCKDDKWWRIASPAIQARIQKYSDKEIRCTLLALIKSPREVLTAQLDELKKKRAELEQNSKTAEGKTADDIKSSLAGVTAQIADVERGIEDEKKKVEKWKVENIRRRHNYFPLVYNLLKAFADRDKLTVLVENATKIVGEREAAATKAKSAATTKATTAVASPKK